MSARQTSTREESNEEMLAVAQLREWVENEADFKSRKEDDFLLMFLRSCDFKQDLARKTLTKYYQNKVNIPQWWTNIALTDHNVQQILHHKFHTLCICNYEDQPVIGLSRLAKLDFSNLCMVDYMKAGSLVAEYVIRLENCQLNGYVWVIDAKDYSYSITHALIILKVAKNALDAFYIGLPLKLRGIHLFNVSFLVTWFCKTVVFSFLPSSIKEIFHLHEGDLRSLSDFLPAEWLPEEFGGCAGPISQHHDVFLEEMQKMNDYFLDDVNYGYCK